MELRNIESFLEIAKTGSFSAAAARLGYTQSAVTMQIKQLEAELGVTLFTRGTHGAKLTAEGSNFAFHAREIVSQVEAARSCTMPAGAALKGELRIGSIESIVTTLIPEIIDSFCRENPGVEVTIRTGSRDELARRVRENTLDLFLTAESPMAVKGLERRELGTDEIVFVAAPALAASSEYAERFANPSLNMLQQVPLVLTEAREGYRLGLERLMALANIELSPRIEAGNTNLIALLVKRGAGMAFLPRYCVADALEAGELLEYSLASLAENTNWATSSTAQIEEAGRICFQCFKHEQKRPTPCLEAFLADVERFFSERA